MITFTVQNVKLKVKNKTFDGNNPYSLKEMKIYVTENTF